MGVFSIKISHGKNYKKKKKEKEKHVFLKHYPKTAVGMSYTREE